MASSSSTAPASASLSMDDRIPAGRPCNRSPTAAGSMATPLVAAAAAASSTSPSSRSGRACRAGPRASSARGGDEGERGEEGQLAPQQGGFVRGGGVDGEAALWSSAAGSTGLPVSGRDRVVGERRDVLDHAGATRVTSTDTVIGTTVGLREGGAQQRDVVRAVEQRHDRRVPQQRRRDPGERGEQVRRLDRDEQDVDRCGQPGAGRDRGMQLAVPPAAQGQPVDVDLGAGAVGRQQRHLVTGVREQNAEHAPDRAAPSIAVLPAMAAPQMGVVIVPGLVTAISSARVPTVW